jgi:hypothetical protein
MTTATNPTTPAEAILDAVDAEFNRAPDDDPALGDVIAAILRAAADHCHSQEIREADCTTRRWVRADDLLAIAAELEGANG